MYKLRFRQVHLDFHTSECIGNIGKAFDKNEWQQKLLDACVDSITCFSLCHHGWSYHPTEVGKTHPHLDYNLLRSQLDASKEVGINVPVYLSAGLNVLAWKQHPEWQQVNAEGMGVGPFNAGYSKLCFNSPYLDYLCSLISEAARMFPEADGIFLDIITQAPCCCNRCIADMLELGMNPEDEQSRVEFAKGVLLKYYQKTTEAAKRYDSNMPIFHNSGNVQCGNTEILKYFSHLELESLPTGGWGYDHFPLSAAYARNLPFDFLGMTGKFHTSWGEFGGFKHENALRYECAAMLANNAKCSIGDQLHPNGKLDESTYRLIGKAYKEVREKEAWCIDAVSKSEVAILSSCAVNMRTGKRDDPSYSDTGASRLLLEGHIPFEMIDTEMDFTKYKFMVLPDDIVLAPKLCEKVKKYIKNGGKLIMSGTSGLAPNLQEFCFDIGADYHGQSPYRPDYFLPTGDFALPDQSSPVIMYYRSQRITPTTGQSMGDVYDTYFNRDYKHFCSHRHTPYNDEPSGFSGGVITDSVLYFSNPVFKIYYAYGAVIYKDMILKAIRKFMGADHQIETNLPSEGRLTFMEQPQHNRFILHLLYANKILRGGTISGDDYIKKGPVRPQPIEIIEELNPVYDININIKPDAKIKQVTLAPQGEVVEFEEKADGRIAFKIEKLSCHQMVCLEY